MQSYLRGALGCIRNRKTEEKIVQNRKTAKKIRPKPKTAHTNFIKVFFVFM